MHMPLAREPGQLRKAIRNGAMALSEVSGGLNDHSSPCWSKK